MGKFKARNGILVPSSSEDSLEKQVVSTHRKSRIVDPHGRSFYFDRDGKPVSGDAVRAKSAELKTYREGLGMKFEGGTVLDFLINNNKVEYTSDSGRKETADLRDAALKKRFVETVAAVKDALKGNPDYYDAETDTLKLSSEKLKGILGVVDEYAVDHYTADVNVRKRASLRIAQKITARPASVDDKVVQLPVYDGSAAGHRSGAGWAAAAAAGLLLALATGCSLTYDPYASTRRRSVDRVDFEKSDWGTSDDPLRAGIGYVHNGNTSEVTSAAGNQTWTTPSNGLELYVRGSAVGWEGFRGNTWHSIAIPVVLDYRCLWLSDSGSIEDASGSLGNITEGSEQGFRLMSGITYQLKKNDRYVLFRGLIGGESVKDDVSFAYDINDIDVVLDAGGFAWCLGVDGKLNKRLLLGIGYGQTGMNGNQTTDVSSGGIPLNSEDLDVDGTRGRLDFRAVINPFDPYEGDEWYGPTEIIFKRIHDDLGVFDRTSNELGVTQHFNLNPKAALYFGAAYTWGTKDSTDASEEMSGYRIMLGVDLSGLINERERSNR